MRIVAGQLKGRAISAPEGTDTRPTTDRVREALFSSLYSLLGGFEGICVLDAFAGSGALGIEALSRGAAHAAFYERNPKALRALQDNLRACGLGPDKAAVSRRDVLASPPSSGAPFDLVFLDPPYDYDTKDVLGMVRGLAEAGMMSPEAVVVYEHAHADAQGVAEAAELAGFGQVAVKKYGKTGITILR